MLIVSVRSAAFALLSENTDLEVSLIITNVVDIGWLKFNVNYSFLKYLMLFCITRRYCSIARLHRMKNIWSKKCREVVAVHFVPLEVFTLD